VATTHEQNIYNAPGNGPYASSLDVTETTTIFTNTTVTEQAKAEGYTGRPTLQPQQQNLSIGLKSFSSVSVRSGDHIGSVSGGAQAEARSQLFVPVMVTGLPTGTIGTMTLRLNLDGNISGEGNKTNMADVVPPPGAVKGAFVSNSLDNTDVTHAGWPTLPGYQAVNFAKDGSLTPVVVDLSGTTQNAIELVRVWGEPAWELGAYWTMQAPKTEDDFYGQAAIALPLTFAPGSASLSADSERLLSPVGEALASPDLAGYRFRIEGHTDSVGDADANMALSEQRAVAVRNYLVRAWGVDPRRLVVVGFGSSQPLVATPPMPSASLNRTSPSGAARAWSRTRPIRRLAPAVRYSAISPPLFTCAAVSPGTAAIAASTSSATAPATAAMGVMKPRRCGQTAATMRRPTGPWIAGRSAPTGVRSRGSSAASPARSPAKAVLAAVTACCTAGRGPSKPISRSIGPSCRCNRPSGSRAANPAAMDSRRSRAPVSPSRHSRPAVPPAGSHARHGRRGGHRDRRAA
jgi:outer membrane protein OmpA-like peptidoglycan-associated protein